MPSNRKIYFYLQKAVVLEIKETLSYLLVISGPRRGPADTSQFFSEGKGKSVKDEAGERSSPGLSRSTFTLPSARAKPEPVIAGRRPAIEYLCILRFKNIFIN